jgi:hypothetical protein
VYVANRVRVQQLGGVVVVFDRRDMMMYLWIVVVSLTYWTVCGYLEVMVCYDMRRWLMIRSIVRMHGADATLM